ncbi:MAG: MFS transporter [Coprobacillaceae bacterium]
MQKIKKEVIILLGGLFFTRLAWYMSTPFLTVFLMNQRGFSPVEVGYIISINPLANIIFCLFSSYLMKRFSNSRVIKMTPFIWGLVFIGFYFSNSFYHYLLLNLLNGICYSLFEPGLKKMLSDLTPKEDLLIVFNMRYAAINLGAFFGPMISFIFRSSETLIAYVFLGGVYFLYGLLICILLKSSPNKEMKIQEYNKRVSFKSMIKGMIKDKVYLFLIVGMIFSYFGYTQFTSSLSQYLTNSNFFVDGTGIFSLLLSVNAATILLLQFPVIYIIKKVKNPFISLMSSNILIGVGIILFGVANSTITFVIAAIVLSIGELLYGSRFDVIIDELGTKRNNSELYFGGAELIKSGKVLGPIIGAYLISILGYENQIWTCVILALITFIGLYCFMLSNRAYNEEVK